MQIRYKITLLFTFLVTVILVLLNSFIYYVSSAERENLFNNRLKGRANNDAQLYSLFRDSSQHIIRRIDSSSMSNMLDKSIIIFNDINQPVYSFHSDEEMMTDFTIADIERARKYGEYYFKIGMLDAMTYYHADSIQEVVVGIAAFDDYGYNRLMQLRKVLVTTVLLGILVSAFTGYIFSRQLLIPLSKIIRNVRDISTNNLSNRIELGKEQDELYLLSTTFNDLLNSIQKSFNTQRRFISNASHELSTPLTAINSQLEVILQKERSVDEYKEVLQSVQEDILHLRMLTKSLLEMAKSGSQGNIELAEVRVDEMLFRVMADVKKMNPLYELSLDFKELPEDEGGMSVFGNPELLYSSIKNIAENACKYSADHHCEIVLNCYSDYLTVVVINHGDVIPEDDLQNIFQPFYRSSSVMHIKGFGLGLSLAKRIISMHRGEIKVTSNKQEGTVFEVRLPTINAFGR